MPKYYQRTLDKNIDQSEDAKRIMKVYFAM